MTEADLIEHGLRAEPRFRAFVAERGSGVVGIAVHYQIPWTFDWKPVVVLKELFVAEAELGLGAGRALLESVTAYAMKIGASRVTWAVLPDNDSAKRFYAIAGGTPETAWTTGTGRSRLNKPKHIGGPNHG